MSKIRGKNTKPEIVLRKYLFNKGFRYRLNDKKLPGKPDIVLQKYKTVIFVNGCFWHAHENCKYFVIPKTRRDWWMDKLESTKQRDARVIDEITSLGYDVKVIWECDIKDNFTETSNNLYKELKAKLNE